MKELAFFITVFVSLFSTAAEKTGESTVSIMTYNVENLFDTRHDKDKEDFTYLPKALKNTPEILSYCIKLNPYPRRKECLDLDWTEAALNEKLLRLSDAILQVGNGKGPDVLILDEVENANVLHALNSKYLKKAGYKTEILLEGQDRRGIDTAILSRLSNSSQPSLIKIKFSAQTSREAKKLDRLRGVLEARLLLPDGNVLRILGVHLPALPSPTKWRAQSLDFINSITSEKGQLTIVAGDFNITDEEEKSEGLIQHKISSHWLVSHKIGCLKCPGTHYYAYEKKWSFLDLLLFPKEMDQTQGRASWYIDGKSIRVVTSGRYQNLKNGKPAKFNLKKKMGVSDHYPLYAEIRKRVSHKKLGSIF